MNTVMMTKDIVYLPLFKDTWIDYLKPFSHLDVSYFLLKIFWKFGSMLGVTSKRLNDTMRNRAN